VEEDEEKGNVPGDVALQPAGLSDTMMPPRLLLTVAEAAHLLGLGRSLVYELVLKRELASIKIGRARRIPLLALEEFVKRRLAESGSA
jgi:excisionase family DNA binding protein